MYDTLIIPTKERLTPEPAGELFNWTYTDSGTDFDTLTGLGSKVTISQCTASGTRGYQHHAWIEMHPAGYLVAMFGVHDYDEEGIGMWAEWSYSTDDGATWSTPAQIIPPQDTVARREGNAGRVVIPMGFVVANGKCYAVVDVNDRDFNVSSGTEINGNRVGVGFLAVQINDNKSLGTPVWIHNVDNTATAPDPVPTFTAYSYDAGVRDVCYNYFFRPENNPKVSFSDQQIYNNQIIGNATYGVLSEPTTIKPNGYLKVWKYWKNSGLRSDNTYPSQGEGYKVFTIGEDETTFTESVIPDCFDNGAIVTRFTKYGDYIFISGNAQSGNRERLYFAVTSRNATTGKYDTDNVYTIDYDTDTAPDYTGDGKGGGPQSVDVCISGGKIYWIYSQKKEQIHMRKWTISGL